MTKVKILLDSIDKVKNFVNTLIKFDCDFDMIIHKDGDVSDIMEAIKPYIVE